MSLREILVDKVCCPLSVVRCQKIFQSPLPKIPYRPIVKVCFLYFENIFLELAKLEFLYLLSGLSGEGNGNTHQYPCLENPVDRGA